MTYTDADIKRIIEDHRHYLLQDCENWGCMRADLRGANLGGANLRGVNLSYANLSGVNLVNANLSGAYLMGADLNNANLNNANLSYAILNHASLFYAILMCANLSGADLGGADFNYANLIGANLGCADLHGADLDGANLTGANLFNANLIEARHVPFVSMACPDSGSFIGWKKVFKEGDFFIAKLEIPEDAIRSSGTGRKCRCNKANVLRIEKIDDPKVLVNWAQSVLDASFIYRTGETVAVENFYNDRWVECAPGIHFFMTRQEAVEY